MTLSNGSGADLQYTSNDGCLFKFNVSGSTATLANGPVTCSATSNGACPISVYPVGVDEAGRLIVELMA